MCTQGDYKDFTEAHNNLQSAAIERIPEEEVEAVYGTKKEPAFHPEECVVQSGRNLVAKDIYNVNIKKREQPQPRPQERIPPQPRPQEKPNATLTTRGASQRLVLEFCSDPANVGVQGTSRQINERMRQQFPKEVAAIDREREMRGTRADPMIIHGGHLQKALGLKLIKLVSDKPKTWQVVRKRD